MIEIAPVSENEVTYSEAVMYCQFLEYNGHRDWRMPTHDEFMATIALGGSWYNTFNDSYPNTHKQIVIPVRDV